MTKNDFISILESGGTFVTPLGNGLFRIDNIIVSEKMMRDIEEGVDELVKEYLKETSDNSSLKHQKIN